MTQDALKQMYQLLLTEPHAPTVCAQLERIAREALAENAMKETQRLGQEIEQEPVRLQCVTCGTVYADGVPPQVTQPEQEPVAWQWLGSAHFRKKLPKNADITAWNPLYASPPQRKPLTDEQIDELSHTMVKGNKSANWLCRAIEAAHGVKGDR